MKEHRLQAVYAHMDAAGLTQILVTDPVSILYLTGIWIDAEERPERHCLSVRQRHVPRSGRCRR